MSRVINPDGVGKERNRLSRAVVLAIRELMGQNKPDSNSRDLAAFIVLCLDGIEDTIERTVTPWEKRDYWIKADRFRMKWAWSGLLAKEMREAVMVEDWPSIAVIAAKVGQELGGVEVSKRHRMGTPWVGAWEKLNE